MTVRIAHIAGSTRYGPENLGNARSMPRYIGASLRYTRYNDLQRWGDDLRGRYHDLKHADNDLSRPDYDRERQDFAM